MPHLRDLGIRIDRETHEIPRDQLDTRRQTELDDALLRELAQPCLHEKSEARLRIPLGESADHTPADEPGKARDEELQGAPCPLPRMRGRYLSKANRSECSWV